MGETEAEDSKTSGTIRQRPTRGFMDGLTITRDTNLSKMDIKNINGGSKINQNKTYAKEISRCPMVKKEKT
jgi:hypothetical protein